MDHCGSQSEIVEMDYQSSDPELELEPRPVHLLSTLPSSETHLCKPSCRRISRKGGCRLFKGSRVSKDGIDCKAQSILTASQVCTLTILAGATSFLSLDPVGIFGIGLFDLGIFRFTDECIAFGIGRRSDAHVV